jgi:hypothetical protein
MNASATSANTRAPLAANIEGTLASLLPLDRCLLVLFLACAAAIAVQSLRTIGTTSDTSYPESAIVQTALWAKQTGHLYPALNAPPYTPAPYGPLFYLMIAAGAKIAGGYPYSTRVLLRVVVFACYLLVGCTGYRLARDTVDAPRRLAFLAAAVIWAAPFVLFWNVTVRPDFPALLASFVAVWIVARRERLTLRAMLLAGLCCAAAVLIKQSLVAAPLAIALWLIARRAWQHLAAFVLVAAAAVAGVVGYLLLAGEPVLAEMSVIRHSPMAIGAGLYSFAVTLSLGLAVVITAAGIAGFLWAGRAADWRLGLLALYWLIASLVALATLAQIGSNANYLVEEWSIAAVLSIAVLPQLENKWTSLAPSLRLGIVAGLVLLATQNLLSIRRPADPVRAYRFDNLRGLHLLSNDPSLTAHGENPELLDPFLAGLLAGAHVWSPEGIRNEIRRQDFDVIFLKLADGKPVEWHHQPFLSPEILQPAVASYRPLCRSTNMLVLEPRDRTPAYTAGDASYTIEDKCDPIQ